MVRRNTWFMLLVLAALVGFSFYLRGVKTQQASAATPTSGEVPLFSSSDSSPTGIKIMDSSGDSVEFARDQGGVWVVRAPSQAAANQASAEAAATQIGSLRILASVELGLEIVGLDKPSYTFTVTFGSGKIHKLVVGSVTPVQDGYYTQLDGGPIKVVDKFGLDALLNLLVTPPYLATSTPVASATTLPKAETSTPELPLLPFGSPTATIATPTP